MAHTVNAALARKLSAGQDDLGDRPRSVLRALRLALARAAGERLDLPLAVIGARQSNRLQDEVSKGVGDDWLLLLLRCDAGVAAACLDPGLVSAIVQTQTIGEVLADPPPERAFTDTDAAMAAPLVEATFARALALAESPSEQACLSGCEFTSRAAGLRPLTLALVAEGYRVFDLTVELASGARQGQISIILPDLPVVSEATDLTEDAEGSCLESASGVLRAELNAVLCRMALPLAELSVLEVGTVLPLTNARLDRTEILTIDRTRAGAGRLGQCGGMRAVRLNEQSTLPALATAADQDFVESRTKAGSVDDPDKAGSEVALYDPGNATQDMPVLDGDLSFENSDQMVAEISQLAGLDDPSV